MAGERMAALIDAGSLTALETAVKMMAEVASDHLHKITNIDRLPICAGYNFELCIQYLEARQLSLVDISLDALGDLKTLVIAFRKRWPIYDDLSAT